MLSHHPKCENFSNHTLRIGRYFLCIGCFIGYPTAIIEIVILSCLNIVIAFDPFILITWGMILMGSFILSPLHLTEFKSVKIAQKIFIGSGAALLFWGIFSFDNPLIINFLIFLAVFSVLLALLNGYHVYGFLKTCKQCEYSSNWKTCPGFKEFMYYLNDHDLPNIFPD